MNILYTISIWVFQGLIHLTSWFNPKAKAWVLGRKGWRKTLQDRVVQARKPGQPLVWVHCASLGEFEQGRPLIEAMKSQNPGIFVLLTFFSPSGYEVRKNYPHANAVAYLPADTSRNVRDFLRLVQPNLAVFVKYEFWYRFLEGLRNQTIPTILISARLRPGHLFFQRYGGWFKTRLQAFSHIFAQDASAPQLLARTGVPFTVAGDTRVDRVGDIARRPGSVPELDDFCAGHPVLIAGSSWPPDEKRLGELFRHPVFSGWKLLIAPHDIRDSRLAEIEQVFPGASVRFTRYQTGEDSHQQVLIINTMGMLASLYRYGDIAYIGGAFGSGLHNTLEPIAFGLPVLFGPKYEKFAEAQALIQSGGARSICSREELIEAFAGWTDEQKRACASDAASAYVQENQGATKRILDWVQTQFPHIVAPS
ncbi:MAG: 3-deoxy-D-manno-octulosonic acid transferase [Haliscomenobacter sp.]|nr:3-deoxy-D-manno-octulosonic acid transferase [Haliscomenobacter sp.]